MSRLFLIFIFSIHLSPFSFAGDNSDGNSGSSNTAEDALLAYEKNLAILQSSFILEELTGAIDLVIELPTIQAYNILFHRLERLPDVMGNHEIPGSKRVITQLLKAFAVHGSSNDIEMLIDLTDWLRLALRDKNIVRLAGNIRANLEKVKPDPIGRIYDLSQVQFDTTTGGMAAVLSRQKAKDYDAKAASHLAALADVKKVYDTMSSQVVGQEAILRSFETLYLQDLLKNGARKRPEIFYFMGLPGNGKDTIAEAYVDAIWGEKGAHKEHMFRMNIRNKAEAWSYLGSGKGYVGSSELPTFLKFLVFHSGGKYKLESQKDGTTERLVVVKNSDWKQAESNRFLGPHRAVIFVNEAHNIPREVKDNLLKQAIERGIFPISNPGSIPGAVSEIELPVTFVFATNEGIDLLEPRQKNGMRIGAPLTYDNLHDNYRLVFNDKPTLKQAILKNNGEINDAVQPEAPGTSEEFLNRIPEHRIHILEPLSPNQLVDVAKLAAKSRGHELEVAEGDFGRYVVDISEEMFQFIASYKSIPAENARPINARLERFVFDPIIVGLRSEKIKPTGRDKFIRVLLHSNSDGSKSTRFEVIDKETGELYEFSRIIRETLNDVPKKPLSDERIQEIILMRQKMLENVFGVEHIVDRLLEAAIVSESESKNSGKSLRSATVMAFLGKSSTGKTETAKQYVRARYGDDAIPVVIDFNGVRTIEAMEAKIIGSIDHRKNPIASEFMKEYDRAQGNITFIFDEAANSPKEILKVLYEILREAEPSGFSDGKARPMRNVTIILTGNAGEQIYEMIPKNLPKSVYERALGEVFKIFIRNEDLQHRILLQTFPEALLARLGQNVFHFGPLQDDGKRQLAQIKLLQGLKSLKSKPSERGWDVRFSRESDLLALFDMIENEGFDSKQQGASIDKFVKNLVVDKIKAKLLVNKVDSDGAVILEVVKEPITKTEAGVSYFYREIRLTIQNGKTLSIEVPIGQDEQLFLKSEMDQVLTAYHEAGHEIVSAVYNGDRESPKFLSIIEGVTMIQGVFVHYAGVRKGVRETESRRNKQVVLREAAVLAGGYVAQQLVTIGARDDGGKSNDMLRATGLIQDAILKRGLSKRWGVQAIPQGVEIDDYIHKELPLDQKVLLSEITKDWLMEAEVMAREALWLNMDKLFINMSQEIARQGFLDESDIKELYERFPSITERDGELYDKTLEEVYEVVELINQWVSVRGEGFHVRFTENNFDFFDDSEKAFRYLEKSSNSRLRSLNPFFKSRWRRLTDLQKMVASSQIASHLRYRKRDANLSSLSLMPETVANIDKIISTEREQKTRPVTNLGMFPVGLTEVKFVSMRGSALSCKAVFKD